MGIDPEKIRGAITVYRQRRSGAYQIQPMSRYGRLGLADAGETISVAPREDAPLLAVVEKALAAFQSNRYDMPGSPRMSPKEHAQFVRGHDAIMIVRLEDHGLELIPWERVHGGFEALDGGSIALRPPVTAEALADAVREAFKRAAATPGAGS